jgi:prophage maintenance system killer protein
LTEAEKLLVAKFVKISPPPESLPGIREQFSKEFIAELKKCQSGDIDQIVHFAAITFYRITENHWYFNCNGRTATCFINIFLRALGIPSILMRNPQEKNNENSSYSKAIANIDSDINLLEYHIKNRILEAKAGKQFHNEELAKTITLRVQLRMVITAIKLEFPDYKISNDYSRLTQTNAERLYNKYPQRTIIPQDVAQQDIIDCLNYNLTSFIDIYNQQKITSMVDKYILKDKTPASFAQGLRKATAKNQISDMEYFIPLCDVNRKDDNPQSGKTALHLAVIANSPNAVKLLLERGADPSIQDATNNTPLDYATERHNDEITELLRSQTASNSYKM